MKNIFNSYDKELPENLTLTWASISVKDQHLAKLGYQDAYQAEIPSPETLTSDQIKEFIRIGRHIEKINQTH